MSDVHEEARLLNQEDVEILKQENERLQQELHIARLKIATYNALEKEFQESNKALEESLAESKIETKKILDEEERK